MSDKRRRWQDYSQEEFDAALAALAVTLAEPLRRALAAHYDTCVVCPRRGIIHCPEGVRLFRLLPDGDRVVVYA